MENRSRGRRTELADSERNRLTSLGIIAAVVRVPSVWVLDAVQAMPYVYLVDLSQEDYRRQHPEAAEVSQNDLYWHLAGWD